MNKTVLRGRHTHTEGDFHLPAISTEIQLVCVFHSLALMENTKFM